MEAFKFTLSAKGIDECAQHIEACLESEKISSRERTMVRLAMEEILLNAREFYGDEQKAELCVEKNLFKRYLTLKLAGEPFDPLQRGIQNDEFHDFSRKILNSLEIAPTWQYKKSSDGGINTVSLALPTRKMNPAMSLALVAVSAVVAGFALSLLPEAVCEVISSLLTRLFNALFGIISMMAVPVVFFTVLAGIIGAGDLNNLSRRGKRVILSQIGISLLVLACSIAISLLIFPLQRGGAASSAADAFNEILDTLFAVIPNNIITPFSSGNYLQIILLAVMIGCGILAMGRKAERMSAACEQLGALARMLMQWACRSVPVLIAILIVQNILSGAFSAVLSIWKLFAVCIAMLVALNAVFIVLLSLRRNMKISEVLKSIAPTMLTGFITSSGTACISGMLESLQKLGVDSSYAKFGSSLALAFYSPAYDLIFSLSAIYFAHMAGISVSPVWIATLFLYAFFFSIATPPVAGGSVACIVLILSALGVPQDLLGIASTYMMFMGYFGVAAKVGLIITHTAWIADVEGAASQK